MEQNIHHEYQRDLENIINAEIADINGCYNLPTNHSLKLTDLSYENLTLPKYSATFAFGESEAKTIVLIVPNYSGSVSKDWNGIKEQIEDLAKKVAITIGRRIELVSQGFAGATGPLWSYSGTAMTRSAIAGAKKAGHDPAEWVQEKIQNKEWQISAQRIRIDAHDSYNDPESAEEDGLARLNFDVLPATVLDKIINDKTKEMPLCEIVDLADPRDMIIMSVAYWHSNNDIDVMFTDPIVRLMDAPKGLKNNSPEEVWLEIALNHNGPLPYS